MTASAVFVFDFHDVLCDLDDHFMVCTARVRHLTTEKRGGLSGLMMTATQSKASINQLTTTSNKPHDLNASD